MTNLEIQGQKLTDIDRQERTRTYRYTQGHTWADRDRQGQTGTDRDRKGQEGTDRDRQGQTRTHRDIQGQSWTGRDRKGLSLLVFEKSRDKTGTQPAKTEQGQNSKKIIRDSRDKPIRD